MTISDLIHFGALCASVIGIIGTVIWRTSKLSWRLGGLETMVTTLHDWLKDIKDGESPVCARHEQQLANHDRRLGRLDNGQSSKRRKTVRRARNEGA